jgi:hypothetical protein
VSENIILDCYRLAKYYQLHPDVFLEMPITEVDVHMQRTVQLERMRQRQQSSD